MDKTLLEAYTIIHGSEPAPGMEEWQAAKYVLENMDVPKLGEDLAKRTLFSLINRIRYPNKELTTEIVGGAEDELTEFYPERGDKDMDMHVAEWLEAEYWTEKEKGLKVDRSSEVKIK